MAAKESKERNLPTKVPASELIPSRLIQDTLGVTQRTVKRWETKYNWNVWHLGPKLKRYHKNQVEESLGIIFSEE